MIKKPLPLESDKLDKLIFMLCRLQACHQVQPLAPLEFVQFVQYAQFTHLYQYIHNMGERFLKSDSWTGSAFSTGKKVVSLAGGFESGRTAT